MFENVKYKFELAKLYRERKKHDLIYSKKLREIKDKSEREEIENDATWQDIRISDEISLLVTRYLTQQANSNFISVPNYSDKELWEDCTLNPDIKVLTSKGVSIIRSALRKEQRESWEFILQVVVVLSGFIGTVIGLVAVLK